MQRNEDNFNIRNSKKYKNSLPKEVQKGCAKLQKLHKSESQDVAHLFEEINQKTSIERLYVILKQLLKTFQIEIQQHFRQSIIETSTYYHVKQNLVDCVTYILLQSPEYVKTKDILPKLWKVIRIEMNTFLSSIKGSTEKTSQVLELVQSDQLFFKKIFQQFNTKWVPKEKPLELASFERHVASLLLVYMGELKQFNVKLDPQLSIEDALKCYISAFANYPYDGMPCYLISLCLHMKRDTFAAVFYSIRAAYSEIPYDCKDDLKKLLEEARATYEQFLQERKKNTSQNNNNYFVCFAKCLLKFINVIYTKIGLDELAMTKKLMQEYYHLLLDSALKAPPEQRTSKLRGLFESNILLVFCLHYSFKNVSEKYKDKNTLITNFDDRLNECIQAIAPLINTLLAFAMKDYDLFSEYIIPWATFFADHTQLLIMVLDKIPRLSPSIFENMDIITDSISAEDVHYLDIKSRSICTGEDQLLGFLPYKEYFEKKEKVILIDEREIKTLKIKLISNFCRSIQDNYSGLFLMFGSSDDGLDVTTEFLEDYHKKKINEMAHATENIVDLTKNTIVVDGRNVGIRYGETHISSEGLKKCVEFWLMKGHPVQVIVPDYCLSSEEVNERRKNAKTLHDLKILPDSVDYLLELKRKKMCAGIPNWNYDDSYMIEYALKNECFIVTNDKFMDNIEAFKKENKKNSQYYEKKLKSLCINFSFINGDFIPNPDFLKKNRIKQ